MQVAQRLYSYTCNYKWNIVMQPYKSLPVRNSWEKMILQNLYKQNKLILGFCVLVPHSIFLHNKGNNKDSWCLLTFTSGFCPHLPLPQKKTLRYYKINMFDFDWNITIQKTSAIPPASCMKTCPSAQSAMFYFLWLQVSQGRETTSTTFLKKWK